MGEMRLRGVLKRGSGTIIFCLYSARFNTEQSSFFFSFSFRIHSISHTLFFLVRETSAMCYHISTTRYPHTCHHRQSKFSTIEQLGWH